MASNSLIPPYIQTNANNLSYGLGGEVPPEIALQEQALNRKQQIANLLLQRGMQSPQGQMVGRFYVAPSPVQGVAQLANVLAGGYLTHRNDEARKGLADQNRSMTADAIQSYMDKTSPKPVTMPAEGPGVPQWDLSPGEGMTPEQLAEMQPDGLTMQENLDDLYIKGARPYFKEGPRPTNTVMQPPSEQDKRQALIEAMTSQIPGLRQFATLEAQQKLARDEHAAQREFQASQQAQTRADANYNREQDRIVRREGIASNEGMRIEQMKQNAALLQMQIDSRERIGQNSDDLKRELAANKAEIDKAAQARDADLKRELADGRNQTLRELAELKAGATADKPMAPTALRLQQEELDAIGSASSTNADLLAIERQIDSGALKLGLAENAMSRGKNYLGLGDENSRNFSSFKATLEAQRNNSLRLNKGVQTEGDAVRAWNELMESINDPSVVKQRLQEIQRINARAIDIRKANINTIRQEYHKGPMDFSQYESQPAAVGQGSPASGSFSDADKEKRYQEWKKSQR